MRLNSIIIGVTLTCFSLDAQNLVPNPSFENYTTCPNMSGNSISLAAPWVSNGNSSDYFHTCSPVYAPPTIISGSGDWQFPRTGNGFGGQFGYFYPSSGVQREYMQVPLLDTLVSGKCYVVSFFVNLRNVCIYGVNNMAATITASSFTHTGFGFYNSPSHIYKFGNPIITDTLSWVEITGIYIAQGNERYISIGNFKDDTETDTLASNPWPDGTFNGSYYLIDDVSVIPLDSIAGGIPVFAGNDTTILNSDSVFIGQQMVGLNCNWYIGTTLIADSVSGLYVSPTATTTYIVEQNLCGTITYDTVTVFVSGVGVNESNWGNEIKIFPNPNAGEFIINLPFDHSFWQVDIFDIQGRIVHQNVLNDAKINLKLNIETGVYIIRITNLITTENYIKKLVVQK